MPLKLLPLAAEQTGYTVKALRRKIEDGILLEGREYVKAPDGRIHIDMEQFEKWVRGEQQQGYPR